MRNISRRAALAAFPIAAVAVAAPAVALAVSQGPDAALEAAWQRIVHAADTLDAISVNHDTPAEREQWAIMDEAENFIQSTPARTPHGAAIQLWLALRHTIDSNEHDEPVKRRDIDTLLSDRGLDWSAKCIVAALHSLDGINGR